MSSRETRRDRAGHLQEEVSLPPRAVGGASLTQRHVDRRAGEARAGDHAALDAAWGVVQRDTKKAPTAGPSAEDRGPDAVPVTMEPAKHDIKGRVIAHEVVGDKLKLRFAPGARGGARPEMEGYLCGADGKPYHRFTIADLDADLSTIYVMDNADNIHAHRYVVLNPSQSQKPGKPVQKSHDHHSGLDDGGVRAAAARGISGSGGSLPHLDAIQRSFGAHDVSGVRAHVGGAARDASEALGAHAYATGNDVAFAESPSLFLAAHEAAHVVQQRAGVQLSSAVGQAGDVYEQHADAVAARVVAGESAEAMLSTFTGSGGGGVQRKDASTKTPVGVDASKPGQALGHILAANAALKGVRARANKVMVDAQQPVAKVSDDKLLSEVKELVPAILTTKAEAVQAFTLIREHVSGLIYDDHRAVAEAKETTLHHPGLAEAVDALALGLANLLSATSGIGDARPGMKEHFTEAHRTITILNYIQGNLGLKQTHYADLIGRVTIRVEIPVVNLGTGRPRDQIQEHVMGMAVKWNEMLTNTAVGIERFVDKISQSEFKDADAGLMDKVWEKALDLVKKGATAVSGTPLAGEIGIEAIKKIVAHGDALEAARVAQDETTFKAQLRKRINEIAIPGADKPGSPKVHEMIQKLDEEFLKIGKSGDKEDEWNPGKSVVFGEQAKFLKDLEAKSTSFITNVPTMEQVEHAALVEFVKVNHKLRTRSGWRRARTDREYMDGYVEVDFTLDNAGSGFSLSSPTSGTLQCPKSKAVAEAMMETNDKLDLYHLGTHLRLNITAEDRARKAMPELYAHDRKATMYMDPGKGIGGAQWLSDYWSWLMTNCRTSTYDVLTRIRKVEG